MRICIISFKDARLNYFKFMSYVLILFLIISMPFFLHLLNNSGSLISFNKDPSGFSFDNQPSNFYNPLNQSAFKLFTNPIRGNFDNQYFPILYSDLWGDYWGYFSFVSNPNLDSWVKILLEIFRKGKLIFNNSFSNICDKLFQS